MFVAFAIFFAIYVHSEKQIDRANELRFQSRALADELRQSSDDLTRMARSYVFTGNPLYKQHYQAILDIRDGRSPRPINYHDIYWDLVLDDDQRPRPYGGQSIALLDLMRQAGFTEEEFATLAQAKANSDEFTHAEFTAMKLIESTVIPTDVDRLKANLMLFDAAYLRAKSDITQPISQFYQMMDQRTLNAVHVAETASIRLRIVFVSLGLLLIFMIWNAYRALHLTLGTSVNELYECITRLGSGDVLFHPCRPRQGKQCAGLDIRNPNQPRPD